MVSRARLLPHLLLLASAAVVLPAHAEEPPIQYTIRPGDKLWAIATRFYNAPEAYRAIYQHNKAALNAANKEHAKGPDRIFPGTVIELPGDIKVAETLYTRRQTPMDVDLATSVARPDGINLLELWKITRENIVPREVVLSEVTEPPLTNAKLVASAPTAKREPAPEWFSKPDSSVEECAKSLCVRFEQLCYFECLSIAKRFKDGERQNLCDELNSAPRAAAITLPFQVDNETRGLCAELVQ